MQFDIEKIEKAVIAEVSAEIISNEAVWETAKSAIDKRINALFVESVDAQIKARVEESIASGFEREYQKVSSFGAPVGEKTTIRAELEKLIGEYWNVTVDKSGNPTTSSYGVSRAEWLMSKMCADDFKGEMQKHVINVAGSLKDHFRLALNDMVSQMLSEVFKVRSLDDQGINRRDSSIISPSANVIG